MVKCLNCGNECYDRFCPRCGQPTSTTRTTWRSFSLAALADMLRFRGGFLNTCFQLLRNPWKVIADYTHGKRTQYSSPLLLLLTLGIYYLLLQSLLKVGVSDSNFWFTGWLADFSPGTTSLLCLPPVILSMIITYRKTGIKRYNIPELCIAGIFLSSLSFIIDIIFMPVEKFWPSAEIIANSSYLVLCGICAFKAFPIKPVRKAVVRFILFLLVALLFAVIYISFIEYSLLRLFGAPD